MCVSLARPRGRSGEQPASTPPAAVVAAVCSWVRTAVQPWPEALPVPWLRAAEHEASRDRCFALPSHHRPRCQLEHPHLPARTCALELLKITLRLALPRAGCRRCASPDPLCKRRTITPASLRRSQIAPASREQPSMAATQPCSSIRRLWRVN